MSWLFVQALESRSLLSAAPANPAALPADEQRLESDVQQIVTQAQQSGQTLSADVQALGADLQKLANTAKGKALSARFQGDVSKYQSTLTGDFEKIVAAGTPAGLAVYADVTQIKADQGNAAQLKVDGARLATDARRLQADTAPAVAVLRRDLTNAAHGLASDLKAIAGALDGDPAVKADRTKLSGDLTANANTLKSQVRAFATDVRTLLHDRLGI